MANPTSCNLLRPANLSDSAPLKNSPTDDVHKKVLLVSAYFDNLNQPGASRRRCQNRFSIRGQKHIVKCLGVRPTTTSTTTTTLMQGCPETWQGGCLVQPPMTSDALLIQKVHKPLTKNECGMHCLGEKNCTGFFLEKPSNETAVATSNGLQPSGNLDEADAGTFFCLLFRDGCSPDVTPESKKDVFRYYAMERCATAHGCAHHRSRAVFTVDVVGCEAKWDRTTGVAEGVGGVFGGGVAKWDRGTPTIGGRGSRKSEELERSQREIFMMKLKMIPVPQFGSSFDDSGGWDLGKCAGYGRVFLCRWGRRRRLT